MAQYGIYENETKNLLQYFLGAELSTEKYSEREVLHMKDVRNLVWISLSITSILSILLLIGVKKTKQRKKEFILGGILTTILVLALIVALFTFSISFPAFHKILFTNNYWLLPADSLLIQMFPERFFIESIKQIILYSFTLSLLSIIIGILLPGEKNDKRT